LTNIGVRAMTNKEFGVEKIDFEELKRRLKDPDYDEKLLSAYLKGIRNPENGMAPTLLPNEDTVAGTGTGETHDLDDVRVRAKLGMGFLNSFYKVRRRRKFMADIKNEVGKPILLAEGDSWFEYPIWLEDTIDHLTNDHSIYCVSGAGDELADMVNASDPEYEDALNFILEDQKLKLSGILLSGGGNDIVGETFYGFLEDFDATKSAEAHINARSFDEKFKEISENYKKIIRDIRETWGSETPIFIHGYDHANPLPDQGLKVPPLDGWLGEWMRKRGIHEEPLQREIVKLMIDRLYDELKLISEDPSFPNVWLVDNRGLVGDDWNDELHPTDEGYSRVADKFREVMRAAGVYG